MFIYLFSCFELSLYRFYTLYCFIKRSKQKIFMHQTRNVLYQVKKAAENKSSPYYNPNTSIQNQLRDQLKTLRAQTRNQQTQIIRQKETIKQLRNKILFYQGQIKSGQEANESEQSQLIKQFSSIPMIIQNKQLKQQLEITHKNNLQINGKNRELQAEIRQLRSDIQRLQTKVKQLQIVQKIRQERFQQEVQKLTPIIIEETQEYSALKQGNSKLIDFIREQAVFVAFEIFQRSAKQCQGQKKVNSYNIFVNYWNQLKNKKNMGYAAVVQCYKSMKKLQQLLPKQKIFDINDSKARDTMNQWIINTLTEIKYMKDQKEGKLKEQKLFRLLGLLYRSKFPIKGQSYEIEEDIKKYFQDLICQEVSLMLA